MMASRPRNCYVIQLQAKVWNSPLRIASGLTAAARLLRKSAICLAQMHGAFETHDEGASQFYGSS